MFLDLVTLWEGFEGVDSSGTRSSNSGVFVFCVMDPVSNSDSQKTHTILSQQLCQFATRSTGHLARMFQDLFSMMGFVCLSRWFGLDAFASHQVVCHTHFSTQGCGRPLMGGFLQVSSAASLLLLLLRSHFFPLQFFFFHFYFWSVFGLFTIFVFMFVFAPSLSSSPCSSSSHCGSRRRTQ